MLSIVGLIYDFLTTGLNFGTAHAFMALIGMPVLFAMSGFFAGAIGAVLNNFVAKLFGGIEIEIEEY